PLNHSNLKRPFITKKTFAQDKYLPGLTPKIRRSTLFPSNIETLSTLQNAETLHTEGDINKNILMTSQSIPPLRNEIFSEIGSSRKENTINTERTSPILVSEFLKVPKKNIKKRFS